MERRHDTEKFILKQIDNTSNQTRVALMSSYIVAAWKKPSGDMASSVNNTFRASTVHVFMSTCQRLQREIAHKKVLNAIQNTRL